MTLATRVIRFLKKKGYFQDEEASAVPEEEMSQEELLPELQAASVQSRITLGERKGQRVRRLGALEFSEFQAELQGSLCAATQGFSIHSEVYCAPWEREKLEKLCRYIARPAIAEDRLQLSPSGDVVLRLKTPYSDGTSHLLFSGLEFVEKLAALVPPPRIHLTRFFGCLAPHAKIRSLIVPKKQKVSEQPAPTGADAQSPDGPKKTRRIGWAELLARVFQIDMKHCPNCGNENFKPIAAILKTSVIRKILIHLKLPDKPPDIAPGQAASPNELRLNRPCQALTQAKPRPAPQKSAAARSGPTTPRPTLRQRGFQRNCDSGLRSLLSQARDMLYSPYPHIRYFLSCRSFTVEAFGPSLNCPILIVSAATS